MNKNGKAENLNRICSFDFFKGIACFGVVFFHVKIPNYYADGIIQACFRFVIPLFFVISGYFNYNPDVTLVRKKLPAKIKHIGWLCFCGMILYSIVITAIGLMGNNNGGIDTLGLWISNFINKRNIIVWILFNNDPLVNILWFLFALLYCYILIGLVNYFDLYRILYFLCPFFVVALLVLSIGTKRFEWDIPVYYFRNAYLMGFPFFVMGDFVHRNVQRISAIPILYGWFFILLGCASSVAEWFWAGRSEIFVGSVVILIGIIIVCINYKDLGEKSFITKIGRDYSFYVYLFHYAILLGLGHFEYKLFCLNENIYIIYMWLRVFIVFTLSLCMSFVALYLKKLWNEREKK